MGARDWLAYQIQRAAKVRPRRGREKMQYQEMHNALRREVEWAAVAMAASREANPCYMVLSRPCALIEHEVRRCFQGVKNRDLVAARLLAILASEEADAAIRERSRQGEDADNDAAMKRSCDVEGALDSISYMGTV